MATNKESLWNSGHDESVEVNQRALIDKVLARYSGEFTVFRELLQNSDDASSNSAEIHFETQAYLDLKKGTHGTSSSEVAQKKMDLKSVQIAQWTFKNDGIVFRDEDWNRLKKIAEGNPDEEKIGAFGVGFYSLFSITEEPFVTSGDQWMGFYWKDKKDQLFARRGSLPERSEWTTFEMPLREPSPIPTAFDLVRFLSSSITFMVHLREIKISLDGTNLARLVKDSGNPHSVLIPKGFKTSSPSSVMHIKSVSAKPLYIEAEVAQCVYEVGSSRSQLLSQAVRALKPAAAAVSSGFFSSLFSSFSSPATPQASTPQPPPVPENKDPFELRKSTVVLQIFSVEADVRLDKKMVTELQRSTKKNPPNHLRLDLIYTGKEEYDASKREDESHEHTTSSIFQGLRADLDGAGTTRVFIGHATGQTTGIGGHIAARFIPTVERESIDLVDRNVSLWNKELLYVGGFLARVAYEAEMASIQELWKASAEGGTNSIDEQMKTWLSNRCLHALKFFTFHPSTPSAVVAQLLETSFFSSSVSHPFYIMSTAGVKSASEVRIPDPTFASFLTQLSMVPDSIMNNSRLMIDSLRTRGLIKEITFADVLSELRTKPLTEVELIACMKWWISVWSEGTVHTNLPHIRQQLIEATILSMGNGSTNERIIPLSQIQTFINIRTMGSILPLDGPFPVHTIPLEVSKNFSASDLKSAFEWQELSLVDWVQFVTSSSIVSNGPEFDLSVSAPWAERVLNTLARAWPSLGKTHQTTVVSLMKEKTCIPTRSGMQQPEKAYFPHAYIFPDLPVVTLPNGSQVKGNLERVMEALGVRKHVDLQIIFNRMIKTGDWTITELIKYLVSVQHSLSDIEKQRLRQTAAFPKETNSAEISKDQTVAARYKAEDLYEPLDIFRQLQLPIIDWGTQNRWRPSSEEARFLFQLGLKRQPPLQDLIKLASDSDEALRSAAFRYFLDNITKYPDYDPIDFKDVDFIPALSTDGSATIGSPSRVYTDSDSANFGFLVVHPSIRDVATEKLKLRKYPPTSLLLPILESTPPKEITDARKWFEILAGRLSEFSPGQLKQLSQMPIVPAEITLVSEKTGNKTQMRAPKDCYFRRENGESFHSKLFVFVDFGTKANAFLSACGTKHEPSIEEIVQIILSDPKRFYHLSGGKDSYLTELRNISINLRLLSSGTKLRMKRSPMLLGIRRARKVKKEDTKVSEDVLDEDEWDLQYDLMRPEQILIADDTNAFQSFGDSIFTAPQEDILEGFYMELGSPRMSTMVKEEYKITTEIKEAKIAQDIRALILERLPLFLHEHTHAKPRVQYSWLNNEKNFIVRTFGKLVVTKSLGFGTTRLSRSYDTSAITKRNSFGAVELWLAGNSQVDMYEVSISLCKILFDVPRVNDALLFMTILSTDLRALRRRGYNVDRILRKQRAEREAQEQARRAQAQEAEKLISDIQSPTNNPVLPPAPVTKPDHTGQLHSGTENSADVDNNNNNTNKLSRPTSILANQFQGWKRKLGLPTKEDSSKSSAEETFVEPPVKTSAELPQQNLGSTTEQQLSNSGKQNPPQDNVTPLASIESNIKRAIEACREEKGNILQNRESMQTVREALDEGYCDVSGRVNDLLYAGSMGDIKIFVAKDVPDGRNIISRRHDSIARFIHIINPLRSLYKLPPTSVNIFYDQEGESIAFNRNASIFLNLRYYESWHDNDVRNGNLSKALISWFFTLAHEIAHNLVQPHNSEHEFYFSSICEAHVALLGRLISENSSQ